MHVLHDRDPRALFVISPRKCSLVHNTASSVSCVLGPHAEATVGPLCLAGLRGSQPEKKQLPAHLARAMMATASQPVDIQRHRGAVGRGVDDGVACSSSSDDAHPGSLSEALLSLKLRGSEADAPLIDRVLRILADVVSGPSMMMSFGSSGQEARWWDCFAEVYQREVAAQAAGKGKGPSPSGKRQVLADILVWAEVTQDHYDRNTLQFVTGPHMGDESFQRIGKLFAEVKQEKGLHSPGSQIPSGASSEANDKC